MSNACLEITEPPVSIDIARERSYELPPALTSLSNGATVLDLGSGEGAYSFLAATAVGESGCVIGVETTPAMISQARMNLIQSRFCNVSFRLGELEYLPVSDQSIDVIISHYGINQSCNKTQVFREALRVLKPGGRLTIVEMVATQVLPEEVEENGVLMLDDIEDMLRAAEFDQIQSHIRPPRNGSHRGPATNRAMKHLTAPVLIEAVKPA
ncbi:MAG: hypothetical protein ETSY1_28785 [Candidatus Entotheonella factor]|uniref:Arsenite methyltransferase n=1 Tax=Entotheonella factor TaxID=1429438 RepID=W4LDW7_ENTF1|nr:MAG: hypothetical protein ETSY1_28785 [Candidatus Entotheonella factor]